MIKKNITKLLLLLAIAFSALSLTSCSTIPDELDSLDKTLVAYERAIRWRNYNGARALQVKPMKVSDFRRQRLKELRITSYKTIEKVIAPDYSKAELLVDIRYYYDKSAIERVLTDRQVWLYNEKSNRWQLDSSFPDFKLY
ncbi:hypothetical protein MNBD_GAMMA23-1513 [hydrothermal vent metagenome]|uniref:Lipoprotein n=1 Tax=hydrothermal vent metagenome TaxID=652676 RepID=A0A3B1AJD5_9ZZZZ